MKEREHDYINLIENFDNTDSWIDDNSDVEKVLYQGFGDSFREIIVEDSHTVKHINDISAIDVAAYILTKLGSMSTIKLQKLVYYSQAWSLVWDEAPLFKDRIEAWASGPVVPKLFFLHKGLYTVNYSQLPYGNPDKLSAVNKETIDIVLQHYGNRSSQWLVELSHLEDPWKNARIGLSTGENSNREIKLDAIALYYSSLNDEQRQENTEPIF